MIWIIELAREWGGSDICIGFLTNIIDSLISNTPVIYGSKTFSSTQIKNMLDLTDILVFPNVMFVFAVP